MTDNFRSADHAAELDRRDELASFRERFYIPRAADGSNHVYLCGHSLGLQPTLVREYVEQEIADWERLGVEGHFHGKHPWMPYHRLLSESTARLVGAQPSEVVVMNSLTVNLHLMMVSFYRPSKTRYRILVEGGAFPSDQYAVKSQLLFHGIDPERGLLELSPRPGERTFRQDDILSTIEREGASIALVLLGGVNYSTGELFDMAAITRAGHAQGCVVAFDLAHAAGNVELHLHDWNVDFAVWCSYKYLNGGPGCIAGCFVHEKHAERSDLPRFAGWWGHDQETRFQMGPEFRPMHGAEGWQLSNPSILSMAALRASMDLFDQAKIEKLRRKSIALTGYLDSLLRGQKPDRFEIVTPQEANRRGAQLSIRLKTAGREVCDTLIQQGTICDWREPDILRVAPVPFYNSFRDAHTFAAQLLRLMS